MLPKTDFSLEVLPAVNGKSDDQHREGACTQDCPHCPFSVRHLQQDEQDAYVSSEVSTALAMTVQRLGLNGVGDTFSRLLIPGTYQKKGTAPFHSSPLRLLQNPGELSLALGDLDLGAGDDYSGLLNEFSRRFPLDYHFPRPNATRVIVGFRVPLEDDLSYSRASYGEVLRLGREALTAVSNSTDPVVSKKNLFLVETINAFPHAQADLLLDPELRQNKHLELRELLADILAETRGFNPDQLDLSSEVNEGALFVFGRWKSPDFRFSYRLRVVPHQVYKGDMPLVNHPSFYPLAFMPNSVWAGHDTRYQRDESLHFSYPDYLNLLEQSADRRMPLALVLKEAILRKRS